MEVAMEEVTGEATEATVRGLLKLLPGVATEVAMEEATVEAMVDIAVATVL